MNGQESARPGPSSLGYFVLNATDLGAWETFALDIVGMQRGEAHSDSALALRLDHYAQRLLIEPGDEDDLSAIGWELDDDQDLTLLADNLAGHGIDLEEGSPELCRARQVERVVCCTGPDRIRHELFYGPVMAPMTQTFRSSVMRGSFVAGRLGAGHYVAVVADKAAATRFYVDALGLRISDHIRGEVAPGGPVLDVSFLHAATGRHHSAAFAAMPATRRIHHIMVEVEDMNDVGLAFERCKAANVPIMMGLGHHPNDDMFSFYAVTPSGFGLEVGYGGKIIDNSTWAVRSYTTLSDWGHESGPAA